MMGNKMIKIFLGILFLIMLGFFLFFLFKEENIVDDSFFDPGAICPAVCVELWEIKEGECVFNKCGSGCGEDGVNSFLLEEDCLEKLKI
jgi:hypothetical protein